MAYAATAEGFLPSMTAAPGVVALQRALLWLVGASVAIVFIEPSPYELTTIAASIIFFATGLRLRLVFMQLLLLLFLVNIGYSISAASLMDKPEVTSWIATSWYMAFTVIFLAMVVSEDTAARLDMLRRGLIVGALIASLAGIAGYFSLVPGAHQLLTLYDRASGTFKDPNVLGAFLILPALFALQSVVSDGFGKSLRSAIALGIMALAVLLAFSRAAWGGLALTSAFMLALMVLTSPSRARRSRIIVMAVVAAIAVVMLIAVLLSFDSIGEMFKQRASFDQSYDEGRFGRFGRHILGAEMALDLPFGIGPLQFHRYFPEDTHNSYLNAFMSGGWISGICYPALVFITVIMGFRHIFVRVPWQRAYLAIFAAFLGTVGESFIIDTDHWRHFWMMLGAMWGMFAAAQRYKASSEQVITAPAQASWRPPACSLAPPSSSSAPRSPPASSCSPGS
jgi:O-Antigen ligase